MRGSSKPRLQKVQEIINIDSDEEKVQDEPEEILNESEEEIIDTRPQKADSVIELNENNLNNILVNESMNDEWQIIKRLMIKSIVMCNFKSYFGTRTIGPLHKNFTTIVGPNGSGKSNLIEWLLFVFGK